MYNYNNENGAGAFIRDLVIKLIFVIILVLLLIWLFPMPNMKPFYDRIYTENITLMKDTAKSYYTNERLPVKINDKVTMTLGEMVDKHLILNLIDKEGNTCDTQSSYVEVTKLETEYAMKISLSCGGETDYIIEYIGCTNVCLNCNVTPLVAPVEKVVYKPKTIVAPPTIIVKPPVEKPAEYDIWITLGKATEVTDTAWLNTRLTTETTTSNGITTTTTLKDQKTITGDVVYETETKTIYSAMWIYTNQAWGTTKLYPGERLLNLDGVGVSEDAQDMPRSTLDMEVSDFGYFSSGDYQRYINTRGQSLFLNDKTGSSWITSASAMQSASLKSSNFTINEPQIMWNSANATYQVVTTAYLKNATGVTPYYDAALGLNIMYVPHWFELSWKEPTTSRITQYMYTKTVSYTDKVVLKGSIDETTVRAQGFNIYKGENKVYR